MISALDPVLRRVELTDTDVSRIAGVPWTVGETQVVDLRRCLILEVDGHRVRVTPPRGGRAVVMDGAERAVEYVLFWIRS